MGGVRRLPIELMGQHCGIAKEIGSDGPVSTQAAFRQGCWDN